jgi:peptidoglycan/xylan/chitin deacetylase (PgdA/CDA1 family)
MIETVTRNNVVYYGSLLISIPYKVDNAWHTCEFVVDKTQQVAFASYDGLTRRVNFSEAKALTDGILIIGGNYSQASNISVKDLEIDINHMGDCEILYGKNSSSNTDPVYQLISKHNPRLMIFEGHGITAMSETEAQAAYVESGSDTSEEAMQASIDRLNIIFGKLKERGYTPVSLSEIVSWKKGKMELPKRCYACIFDDYRIENYIDYKKRIPFATYGVKAGLAIISDMKLLTDEVVINDKTYTVKDALQMIELAGWYPCSHTKNHRYINNYTVQENRNLFKEDVLSADDHFVYSNVIVYPYGAVNVKTRPAFSESGFQLGITIVADRYNCKGTANYLLSRTELGTRASINSVLEPFI